MVHEGRTTLIGLRRSFHRYPEPGWCEFRTTAGIVAELERIGVDEIAVGQEALASDARMAVPDGETIRPWLERARVAGVREDILERTKDGHTGVVAVIEQEPDTPEGSVEQLGEEYDRDESADGTDFVSEQDSERRPGPCVGLRVDMDALSLRESDEASHRPAAEGFRSEHDGYMHACGHDAHIAMGLGTLEAVKESDFTGTFKVFFQPAEEISGGGRAMARGGYLDDVEYLLAVHVGLDNPTGTVVAGMEKPLAMSHLTVTFEGASAHAGTAPNAGANAMQAVASAVQNAYAIPRHSDGMTRINFGRIEGGTASNVIAEEITLEGEIRGETTALMEYTRTELERVLYAAAEMHDCDVTPRVISESPSVDSDPALRDLVSEVARGVDGVDSVVPTDEFGASEDATYLMERVSENGGLASYVLVGTDSPTNHQTPTFDIDEDSLEIGVSVLSEAVLACSERYGDRT
ncbi:indole-3-acetyl-L-aspartic acid hydrolase (plasmid) [Halostagnicola larsenii XH-48]|uniref:Indole-3-acetyl-L-aspartic acid hydrolase n=1 Tax=Halostagnicola larsenii XH-48 TaxID=797299 RepID=W0JR59_9EURY|nr:amidohydrolase [Halostagnicola larsenii]AHG01216.1 indole-3-acetyl-L-aspartic acid hydrolase [Halostagnicola larsenii XH-48]